MHETTSKLLKDTISKSLKFLAKLDDKLLLFSDEAKHFSFITFILSNSRFLNNFLFILFTKKALEPVTLNFNRNRRYDTDVSLRRFPNFKFPYLYC